MSFQLNCRQLGSIRYRITDQVLQTKVYCRTQLRNDICQYGNVLFLIHPPHMYIYIASYNQYISTSRNVHRYLHMCTRARTHTHSSLHVSYIYKYFINKSTQRGGHPIKNRKPWSNYQMKFLKEKDAVLIYAPQ